jgi:hypothetical protein
MRGVSARCVDARFRAQDTAGRPPARAATSRHAQIWPAAGVGNRGPCLPRAAVPPPSTPVQLLARLTPPAPTPAPRLAAPATQLAGRRAARRLYASGGCAAAAAARAEALRVPLCPRDAARVILLLVHKPGEPPCAPARGTTPSPEHNRRRRPAQSQSTPPHKPLAGWEAHRLCPTQSLHRSARRLARRPPVGARSTQQRRRAAGGARPVEPREGFPGSAAREC